MISASLQTLKDTARSVRRDAAAIERTRDEAFYEQLLAVARANLGELWQYTSGAPKHYSWECPANGAGFEIRIPGHRSIYARFGVLCSGRAYWHRLPYSGSTHDVERENAWWMVSPPDRTNLLPSYYHTLGAALVAAEEWGE